MLKSSHTLVLFLYLAISQIHAQCPVFQNGAVGNGQANRTVVFYDTNGDTVAVCGCQLTGNELKCHHCKPDEENYYYYEIFINGELVICYSSVALGVDLKGYSAKFDGTNVACVWSTFSEQNNAYFYWQKSPDGQVLWDLPKVQGRGTTNENTSYSFADTDPLREWAYYRLVQVDLDGKQTYYPWIYVYKDEMKTSSLRLVPNPTKGSFTFILPYHWQSAEVVIINIAGVEVYRGTVSNGEESIQPQIKPGRYTVQVKTSIGCAYGTLIVF